MSFASSPSHESISPGKCAVCGTETWMRCSACSQAGLDWMSFCSVEHQKLIWPIHKRFCGPRSNPFQWPLLTQEESDQLYEGCQRFYAPAEGGNRCLLDVFVPFSPTVSLDSRKARFRIMLERLQESNNTSVLSATDREQLVKLRSEASELEHCGPKTIRLPGTSLFSSSSVEAKKMNPINEAIRTQESQVAGLASKDPSWASWWSTYQLRYMNYRAAYTAYMDFYFSNPISPSPELGRYVDYTAQVLKRYCVDVVAHSDPGVARLLSKSVRTSNEIVSVESFAL